MDHAFDGISKKSSPNTMPCRFSPMLSSRNCIALHFMVRSVIYFEFIFVKGMRSSLIKVVLIYVNGSLFQNLLVSF